MLNLRVQFLAAVFLGSLLVSSCASTPAEKKEAELQSFAEEVQQEKEIGKLMAAKLAGHFGTYDEDALLQYLNLLGRTVAQQAGRPELTFRFGVLKDDEVNAFATPGGYVFVTTGLLKAVSSEPELAGILGHEIAHVTERHMYNEINPKREVSAGESVARMLSRGGGDMGFTMTKMVNAGLEILLEKGYGPEKEQEADGAGVVYSSATGYDPGALYAFLERLSKSPAALVGKTHPPFPERLKSLRAFMENNGLGPGKTVGDTEAMDRRFKLALGKVRGLSFPK